MLQTLRFPTPWLIRFPTLCIHTIPTLPILNRGNAQRQTISMLVVRTRAVLRLEE